VWLQAGLAIVSGGTVDLMEEFLTDAFLGKPLWLWLSFIAIVFALLLLDLGVLHRDHREIGVRESLLLSGGYIGMGVAYGAWVWSYLGAQSGMEYLTGFMIEKSLAMDNVFVIAMIFTFFAIPAQFQHRVLFWGIVGVIVLRALMIGLGAALVTQFSWVLYVFGAFLLITGVKMLLKFLRVTDTAQGGRFWVRLPAPQRPGGPPSTVPGAKLVWWATPLFLALMLIEVIDLVFAVDSVPAIFAITQDPFIVYTSNIFAILGLRALYFALAAMIHRFAYLKYALALVLVFIGGKILTVNLLGKLPSWISLSVTFGLLLGGVLYSLHRTRLADR
jgi:tellurite resistance protein TerC